MLENRNLTVLLGLKHSILLCCHIKHCLLGHLSMRLDKSIIPAIIIEPLLCMLPARRTFRFVRMLHTGLGLMMMSVVGSGLATVSVMGAGTTDSSTRICGPKTYQDMRNKNCHPLGLPMVCVKLMSSILQGGCAPGLSAYESRGTFMLGLWMESLRMGYIWPGEEALRKSAMALKGSEVEEVVGDAGPVGLEWEWSTEMLMVVEQ
ncbi:predicted protein [Postia placenta Mad-698-R]|nr:predicted protein [Postia placenta Mad-698-R]